MTGIQLSFSAAERYLLSARSYFLHYLLRLRPIKRSSALFFGNAVDEGINELLHNIKNGVDVETATAKAKMVFAHKLATFEDKDARVKGVISFTKADLEEWLIEGQEIPSDHDRAWYSLREKGLIMISAYAEQVLPNIKEVHAIQHRINATNESGDTFVGVVDAIVTWKSGKRILLDHKTSTVKYDDDSVEKSAQLGTYFEVLKDEFRLDSCGYVIIPKRILKKKEPKCEITVMIGDVKEEIISETFQKYDQVLHGIKNGKFECSKKCCDQFWGCDYQKFCDSNGKDTTGLEYQRRRE